MKIIPHDDICKQKNLIPQKEYEVLEIDDDMPAFPDLYFKVRNEEGKEVWISDWDCTEIPRIDRRDYLGI